MMKPRSVLAFSLFLTLSASSLLAEDNDFPLWPEGKTPYAKPHEDGTPESRPKIVVYAPTEESRNGTAVVVCPGGGYGGLAIDHEGQQIGQFFQERGITAFVLHYRLGSKGHHFPTQLADVQRGIRFARSEAEKYKIDPERTGVLGFSAGGHLASMAATKFDEKAYEPSDAIDELSARPDFAILCYPVISMGTKFGHGGSRNNLLGIKNVSPDSAEAQHVSSELNVTAKTPPTFIFQTNDDTVVSAENAVLFYLALRKHKVPAEMHIYEPGVHGVGLMQGDPVLSTWSTHMMDWLRDSEFLSADLVRKKMSGMVSLDGSPAKWGAVSFRPDNPNLPVTNMRVFGGKFSGSPVATSGKIVIAASIWGTTREDADRVITVESLSPGDKAPITFDIKTEGDPEPLNFELKSK